MNIKVTIEFEDEFKTNQIAVSGVDNIADDLYDSHLELITMYVVNAITALGFNKQDVEEYFRDI